MTPDFDTPKANEDWCIERRSAVVHYLSKEKIPHGPIGEWPAWHIAPYISVWAVESHLQPGALGWWVVSGDLPTDYISGLSASDPREAIRFLGGRWQEVSEFMLRGEKHPDVNIGTSASWPKIGPLLRSRSQLLAKWAGDDSMW